MDRQYGSGLSLLFQAMAGAVRAGRSTYVDPNRVESQEIMTSLKEQIRSNLTAAMKDRDELTTATLRMLLTAVSTEEVSGKQARELSDDEVLTVVAREAKKRREAAEAFTGGGRAAQAQRELDEEKVLSGYLPSQLSDEEVAGLVAGAIAETGASGPREMGLVMKTVTPRIAGRADGKRVSDEVRRQLA